MTATAPTRFGELLKWHRLAAGLSQEGLAERAGLSAHGVSDLERGARRAPRAETLRLLAEALDLSPQERAALAAAARPGLAPPAAPSPPHASTSPPHLLPAPPTPLVGRVREVADACARLRDEDVRLLTLLGPGGVGKTRLALAVAAELEHDLAGAVTFVDLAPVRAGHLVLPALARALGVPDTGDRPLAELVRETLGFRRLLLVLDNCEHLLPAVAELVGDLLATCPALRILATSRAPLRLRGEHAFPVPPLALPDPLRTVGPAELERIEAVTLFVACARAVNPAFALTETNAAAVAAVCVRLDGLPLAIELAAARTTLLPPPALLARLERRLPLLTAGPRDLPARQQTMRETIGWSHDLLDSGAQKLFARLAIFAGGATIDAIEAVCGDEEPGTVAGRPVFELASSLAEQSLLRAVEQPDGAPRLAMLETIREYALERLEARGETEAVRRRHAAVFLALAEEAEPALTGPDQVAWLDRLEVEHDNLRAALEWASTQGEAELGMRLTGALWQFWWMRGHLSEGRARLAQALVSNDAPAAIRAKALDGAGALAEAQGDCDQAVALHEAALALHQQLGDQLGCARSLQNLGIIEQHDRGNYARAHELFAEALALFRAIDDAHGIAAGLNNLGTIALRLEDFARATALFTESLERSRALGDRRGIGIGLSSLGALAFVQEDVGQARARYEESLAVWRELGDSQDIAVALGNLGEALQYQGDMARAEALYREALPLCEELGDKQGVAFLLSHLARLAHGAGDEERAVRLFVESLALCQQVGEQPRQAECLEGLAGVVGARGEPRQATRLFGAAEALREAVGAPRPAPLRHAYERDLVRVRAALDQTTFAAAWAEGRQLSPDDVVAATVRLGAGSL
jgi:predicted ATPase/DNA-binding XRE family transcriptional regulator